MSKAPPLPAFFEYSERLDSVKLPSELTFPFPIRYPSFNIWEDPPIHGKDLVWKTWNSTRPG